MQPRVEKITLSSPLRGVRLLPQGAIAQATARLAQEAELQKTSFENGKREGERALGQQLIQQRSDLLQIQNGIFESLRQSIPQLIRQSETTLVAIALEAARKLLAQTPITQDLLEASIRETLAELEEQTELHILLHPDDLALLQQLNSPTLLPQGRPDPIHFHPSSEVSRGGCLVQSRFGTLDARRETKWELLNQAVLA